MQDYHNLDIWKRSHVQALEVRKATRKFPRSTYSQLKKQMTTAAESIAFNIVEGCGASTQKEFARFLDITIKSAYELEYQLELARDYGVLPPEHQLKLAKETYDCKLRTPWVLIFPQTRADGQISFITQTPHFGDRAMQTLRP